MNIMSLILDILVACLLLVWTVFSFWMMVYSIRKSKQDDEKHKVRMQKLDEELHQLSSK